MIVSPNPSTKEQNILKMKWSMDHVLTWCFMTEFMLTVDLHRLINSLRVYYTKSILKYTKKK
jgi:hypothetical protein